ncbi:MAG: 4Fe-4S binding protein [Lachnospiraceae bacterium]|nr:4Fe-4S binding protein [Lachnospiraceae bacterium]
MKRVYVNEEWCLGCHLCEFNCAYANSGLSDMVLALKGKPIYPRIHVEEGDKITYAVSCRHCEDPICVKSCIAGAITKEDGVVRIDSNKCVDCYTCILVCPYGALAPGESGAMQKCELCLENSCGAPACAAGCPNNAIVYEDRGPKSAAPDDEASPACF